jgi:hypothetical protein
MRGGGSGEACGRKRRSTRGQGAPLQDRGNRRVRAFRRPSACTFSRECRWERVPGRCKKSVLPHTRRGSSCPGQERTGQERTGRPQSRLRTGSIICTTIGRARFSNTYSRALESTAVMMLAGTGLSEREVEELSLDAFVKTVGRGSRSASCELIHCSSSRC